MTDWGQTAARCLEQLARLSDGGHGVTRLPFTSQHRAALRLLTTWMQEAGLQVQLDDAGTLIGRHDGTDGAGTFYIGSHQDSVRHGGAFDGIMGIVLPILAFRKLAKTGAVPRFNFEILGFADEEGVRWPTALIGSRALAGTFDPAVLEMVDNDGISLRRAMTDFGLTPDRIPELRRSRQAALGYLEAHIEQGPILQECGEPLGVVTAICGIERHQIILIGETGHAGTLPMESRRDALVGAAQIVTEVDRMARATPDLRATVGALHIAPNVVNAVPGSARFTVELRSPFDAVRTAAGAQIQSFTRSIAAKSGLHADITRSYAQNAQHCDPALTATLARAVAANGSQVVELPSGATHDASAMADLCPISMLFVRCRDGISHSPAEHADAVDLGHAVTALARFLTDLDARA